MYCYFAYCTYMDPDLVGQKIRGGCDFVTKGTAVGHTLQFRTAGARDRGWCHISNGPDGEGQVCLGIIYETNDRSRGSGFDHYERIFLTVHGEDGKTYDCYTSRLVAPGAPMALPDSEWEHVSAGMKRWGFPETYVSYVERLQREAAPSKIQA
jgi:hypothetical protein